MNIRIKCNSNQSEKIQQILFEKNITWPNGGTNVVVLMGDEHYLFVDNEYVWSESADAFKVKESYKEVYADDFISAYGNMDLFVEDDKEEIREPFVMGQGELSDEDKETAEKIVEEINNYKEPEFTDMSKRVFIENLMAGTKLQGKMFDECCYCEYDESHYNPFRFICTNPDEDQYTDSNGNYNQPMSDGIWNTSGWKVYVPKKKMTLRQIEEELGYKIQLVEEN